MCGVPLDARHGHVVEVAKRSLACACRACYLLFTRDGAAGGAYRAVPERYLRDPDHPLTPPTGRPADPGRHGVLLRQQRTGPGGRLLPEPGRATECLLDLDAWDRLARTHRCSAPRPT
jgi:hypothetical protein